MSESNWIEVVLVLAILGILWQAWRITLLREELFMMRHRLWKWSRDEFPYQWPGAPIHWGDPTEERMFLALDEVSRLLEEQDDSKDEE